MDDGNGLENRSGCKLTGGSNPSPSAEEFGAIILTEFVFKIIGRATLEQTRGGARVDDWGRLLSG